MGMFIELKQYGFRQWQHKGGEGGHVPQAALCRVQHLEEQKYGFLKFGRFWQIGICIADSDIFTPLTPLTLP